MIKARLRKGKLEDVYECLNRPYTVSGKVVKNRGIGTGIGFPTANIIYPVDKLIPNNGVYTGKAETEFGTFNAIINIGIQPTVSNKNTPMIEAHLLDFNNDLYDTTIKIKIYSWIRNIIKFDNYDELINQLKKDKKCTERYFGLI